MEIKCYESSIRIFFRIHVCLLRNCLELGCMLNYLIKNQSVKVEGPVLLECLRLRVSEELTSEHFMLAMC